MNLYVHPSLAILPSSLPAVFLLPQSCPGPGLHGVVKVLFAKLKDCFVGSYGFLSNRRTNRFRPIFLISVLVPCHTRRRRPPLSSSFGQGFLA